MKVFIPITDEMIETGHVLEELVAFSPSIHSCAGCRQTGKTISPA